MKNKMKNANGITLLALVITIVILIILATITINMIFGENGLVNRTEEAKLKQSIAESRERLELVLADAYAEKKVTQEYTEEEFLNEHLEDFIHEQETEANIFEYGEDELISLNGHAFYLDRRVPKLGEYAWPEGELPALITRIDVTNKTFTEISIDVKTVGADDCKYKYSIKEFETDDSTYGQVIEKSENTNTFTGLTSPKIYTIKVELIENNEVADTETVNVKLGEVDDLTLSFGKHSWSNGVASMSVNTITSYQIEYQIGGIEEGSWKTIANGGIINNIPNNSDVYARLSDGSNKTDYIYKKIVDDIAPTITRFEATETTETTIKVEVSVVDNESGISKIEYSKDDGTSYKTGTLEYIFEGLEELTEYTIKLKVTDKAGNIAELSKKLTTDGIPKWNGQSNDKVDAVISDDGMIVPVPHGFVASKVTGEKTVNGGFVIYQGDTEVNDSNLDNEIASRNQFVWIPVDDYTTMYTKEIAKLSGVTTTTKVYSKFRDVTADKPGSTTYREPDLVTTCDTNSEYYEILGYTSVKEMADKIVEEYNATYESIKHYGGFYIGRFELTGTVDNPTILKNETIITNQNWYDYKKACTKVVSSSSAQTTLIYGNQWDRTINIIEECGYNLLDKSWGNYTGTKRNSGYNELWKVNNIYDLAGNCWEWTQEAAKTDHRTLRGGSFMDDPSYYNISSRLSRDNPSNSSDIWGNRTARAALYIKF